VANLLERVLRVGEGAILRKLKSYAQAINAIEAAFTDLTDDELRAETVEFRERYANGESLDELLPEAFAAVREAASRLCCGRWADGGRTLPPSTYPYR
jgi:preprotein translocase subunit SecA